MADVLILSGPPGAGKTAVAEALADRYDRVAHIQVDTLRRFITPTGFVPEGAAGREQEWRRQQRLAMGNAISVARNFLAERIGVIIEDVVALQEDLDFYVEGLKPAGVPLHFVILLPRLEVCLQRDAARSTGRAGRRRIEAACRLFESASLPGAVIDSSDLSAAAAADRLQQLTTSGASLVGRE